jgi:uncharacterized protein DUF6502
LASPRKKPATRSPRVDSRGIARKALLGLLEPLAGFVLDSGLSIHDLTRMFREAAVRSVAAQQREGSRRLNISGISASTGIPRAEVSRILNSASRNVTLESERGKQSTNKVLAAWHQNPKYTNANGQPADLRIYGRGATFEKLVESHARGIPVRAMLDELTRTGAIEIKSPQVVRMKSLRAIDRGATPQVLKAFGERSSALLSTLLQNMRHPEAASFVASASGTGISQDAVPWIRTEVATRGARFLADLEDLLEPKRSARGGSRSFARSKNVSVTVFLHESSGGLAAESPPSMKRRNFRRGKNAVVRAVR